MLCGGAVWWCCVVVVVFVNNCGLISHWRQRNRVLHYNHPNSGKERKTCSANCLMFEDTLSLGSIVL